MTNIDYQWQQHTKNKRKRAFRGLILGVLALVGGITMLTLAYNGAQAHFYNRFSAQNSANAHKRADAQVRIKALEALQEGQMETLPLVLKRTRDFINGK